MFGISKGEWEYKGILFTESIANKINHTKTNANTTNTNTTDSKHKSMWGYQMGYKEYHQGLQYTESKADTSIL